MICVDANVLIGAISSSDLFHEIATDVLSVGDAIALNVTFAEALVRPHRSGEADAARTVLDILEVSTVPVSDEVADRASRLRAEFGNRHFPMLDALVVAHGIEHGLQIVTADDKWPGIEGADVRVLSPSESGEEERESGSDEPSGE